MLGTARPKHHFQNALRGGGAPLGRRLFLVCPKFPKPQIARPQGYRPAQTRRQVPAICRAARRSQGNPQTDTGAQSLPPLHATERTMPRRIGCATGAKLFATRQSERGFLYDLEFKPARHTIDDQIYIWHASACAVFNSVPVGFLRQVLLERLPEILFRLGHVRLLHLR